MKYTKKLLENAHEFLTQKGVTSMADNLSAYSVERYLVEFVIKQANGINPKNSVLPIPCVRVFCPKCNEPYITYTEHEHYKCNSCDHEWI